MVDPKLHDDPMLNASHTPRFGLFKSLIMKKSALIKQIQNYTLTLYLGYIGQNFLITSFAVIVVHVSDLFV